MYTTERYSKNSSEIFNAMTNYLRDCCKSNEKRLMDDYDKLSKSDRKNIAKNNVILTKCCDSLFTHREHEKGQLSAQRCAEYTTTLNGLGITNAAAALQKGWQQLNEQNEKEMDDIIARVELGSKKGASCSRYNIQESPTELIFTLSDEKDMLKRVGRFDSSKFKHLSIIRNTAIRQEEMEAREKANSVSGSKNNDDKQKLIISQIDTKTSIGNFIKNSLERELAIKNDRTMTSDLKALQIAKINREMKDLGLTDAKDALLKAAESKIKLGDTKKASAEIGKELEGTSLANVDKIKKGMEKGVKVQEKETSKIKEKADKEVEKAGEKDFDKRVDEMRAKNRAEYEKKAKKSGSSSFDGHRFESAPLEIEKKERELQKDLQVEVDQMKAEQQKQEAATGSHSHEITTDEVSEM